MRRHKTGVAYESCINNFLVDRYLLLSFQAIFKMTDSVFSKELSTPDKLTDKIFHEFDIDRDGVLGYNEFCEGVARDPFLLHLLECDPDGSE